MASDRHPKEILYTEAYDPLVTAWFDALLSDSRLDGVVADAPGHGVATNVRRLIELFAVLARQVVHTATWEVDVVAEHRDAVLWEGYHAPTATADQAEIADSLACKLERNIGQALIEALLCLDSAQAFLSKRGCGGASLRRALARSTTLVAGLAVLHNDRQIPYVNRLAGTSSFMYPDVTPERVVSGEFRIAPRYFTLVTKADGPRVKFRQRAPELQQLASPTMTCPAHRRTTASGLRLNDRFWFLLVEVYCRSAGPTLAAEGRADGHQEVAQS